jgi:hypothetical protein
MTQPTALIESGLRAWADGDLDALEAILDPQVTLRWVRPGPWDCEDRDQVMRLLRQRRDERGDEPNPPVEVTQVADDSFIVSSRRPADDDPDAVAICTRVTVAGDKVVAMQQFPAAPPDQPTAPDQPC